MLRYTYVARVVDMFPEAQRRHVPRGRQPVDVHKDCVLGEVGTEVMCATYVNIDIPMVNTTIIVSDMSG